MRKQKKYQVVIVKRIIVIFVLLAAVFIGACAGEKTADMWPATAVFDTSVGGFKVKLATDRAHKTCENFINLA